jgi:hypothetical protein
MRRRCLTAIAMMSVGIVNLTAAIQYLTAAEKPVEPPSKSLVLHTRALATNSTDLSAKAQNFTDHLRHVGQPLVSGGRSTR